MLEATSVPRRRWLSAGWPRNVCLGIPVTMPWWRARPAGYNCTGCNVAQSFIEPWVQIRPGSITALGVINRVAPGAGESVESRVAYDDCTLGSTQYTPTLTIGAGVRSGYVQWVEGTYPFQQDWVVWVEFRGLVGTTCDDLEWVVEVTTVC